MGLSTWIEQLSFNNDKLMFVIGGPLGLSKRILGISNEVSSLSKLTLTHEMSRLLHFNNSTGRLPLLTMRDITNNVSEIHDFHHKTKKPQR